MALKRLFAVSALAERASKNFEYTCADTQIAAFIIKWQGGIYAYKNSCPHTGISMNWQKDVFFGFDNTLLQCSTHGAQFRPEDGYCIWGPCIGQSLHAISVIIENGIIFIEQDDSS